MAHLSLTAAAPLQTKFSFQPPSPRSSLFTHPLADLSRRRSSSICKLSRRRRRRNSLREKLLSFPGRNRNQDFQYDHVDEIAESSQLHEDTSSDVNEASLIHTVQSGWRVPPSLNAPPLLHAGAAVLCAFCVVGAMVKLFTAGGGIVELSKEEAEMLRRKKKVRMEKEAHTNILQHKQELAMAPVVVRPQLDRRELLKCIENVENSPRRHVENSPQEGKDSELSTVTNVSKNHTVADASTKPMQGGCSETDSPADYGSNKQLDLDARKTTVVSKDRIGAISDGGNSEVFVSNTNKVFVKEGSSREISTSELLMQASPAVAENTSHGCSYYTPTIMDALANDEVNHDESTNVDLTEKEFSCIASCTSGPTKNIPKIVKSVTEAKEYLLGKQGISTDETKSRELGCPAAGVSSSSHLNDGKTNVGKSRTISKSIKVVDPCNLSTAENGDVDSWFPSTKSVPNQVFRANSNEADTRSAFYSKTSDERYALGLNTLQSAHDIIDTKPGHAQVGVDGVAPYSKGVLSSPGCQNVDSKAGVKTCKEFGVCNVTTSGYSVGRSCQATAESKKLDSSDPKLGVRTSNISVLDNGDNAYKHSTIDAEPGNKHDMKGPSGSKSSFQSDLPDLGCATKALESINHVNWLEDNFEQFDPVIKKIGAGFRENYLVAKEKVQQTVAIPGINERGLLGEDDELEWMKDEKLRNIVFRVRDNELAGRDPFHSMDAVDQSAFFKGLELKAEKVNAKILGLHEWIHSRIENLDYGADGICLDDPVEKIIPRWKEPKMDKGLEFLEKFTDSHVENISENVGQSLQKSEELPHSKNISHVNDITHHGASVSVNTHIECSDGSRRPGRKTGKEHWQHTKRWSQGFLEVYNSENDPEIKSIMKDMGKGLDRWITEKEKQEVSGLMSRIPKRKRRFIQKKMGKLKREMDMYGAQAVISKYREYSDGKAEDYLWWLDLQFVLCIELYTVEDGAQKIGFYSLEMAKDLQLSPAQYHVIAFEDPGDSKNFCYIVQTHMDMRGSGRSFVVPRPPKDAFREAKANGFSVTVIRKGEVVFNVDQTLEEVEEQITEIGSRMYHEKIMKERGVDVRTLMRGVVSAEKAAVK